MSMSCFLSSLTVMVADVSALCTPSDISASGPTRPFVPLSRAGHDVPIGPLGPAGLAVHRQRQRLQGMPTDVENLFSDECHQKGDEDRGGAGVTQSQSAVIAAPAQDVAYLSAPGA